MACKVFAIAAHPDDIEFNMAGTLILLLNAGCDIHYMNIANGSCGSAEYDAETIKNLRFQESINAANLIEATFYPPLVNDLEIFYEKKVLAKVASIMRMVAPDILLVHFPLDYMEDHINACRLAVTAAFCRGMKNFPVDPPISPVRNDVTIYHSQPHGNRDSLNHLVHPDIFIDISTIIEEKTNMLAQHKTQKEWLDRSQGMNAYLDTMKRFSRELGEMSKQCEFAEGWHRHNPFGLCAIDADPLGNVLRDFVVAQAE